MVDPSQGTAIGGRRAVEQTLSDGVDSVNNGLVRQIDGDKSTADIQSEIDDVHDSHTDGERGVVIVSSEHTATEPLILKTGVELHADLRLADGCNDVAVKTQGFDTLTGENVSYVDGTDNSTDASLPYNFGYKGRVHGNKDNNSSSSTVSDDGIEVSGIALYGKNFDIDAEVFRTVGCGLYSEGGRDTGVHSWRDKWRSNVHISVFHGAGRGIVFRGPHDSLLDTQAAFNGGSGVTIESGSASLGYVDDLYLHAYGNGDPINLDTGLRATYIHADFDSINVNSELQASGMRLTAGNATINFNAPAVVGTLKAEGDNSGDSNNHGVVISNNNVNIGLAKVSKFTGDGVRIDADYVTIDNLRSVNNGEVNLNIAPNGGYVYSCDISFSHLVESGTAALRYGGGDLNRISGTSNVNENEVGWDPSGSYPSDSDKVDVVFDGTGTGTGKTVETDDHTVTGDGSTSDFSVSHDLIATPRNVRVTAGNEAAAVNDIHAPKRAATDSTFDVRFSSPISDGVDVDFAYTLEM